MKIILIVMALMQFSCSGIKANESELWDCTRELSSVGAINKCTHALDNVTCYIHDKGMSMSCLKELK
jgi:hypothetical protein